MTAESFARQNADDRLFAGLAMPPRVVTLPFPVKELSQNARVHWRVRADAVKKARTDAFYLTKEAFGATKPKWQGVRISYTFHPPSKARYDRDGLNARLKAYQDGIADALGIDDYHFVPTYAYGPVVKGGAVRVEIRPL